MSQYAHLDSNLVYNFIMQKQKQDSLEALAERAAIAFPNSKAIRVKHNPSVVSPSDTYIHGAGGLLSDPGQNPAMFSGIVRALPGMATFMPVLKDPVVNGDYGGNDVPFITTITGVTDGDDSWSDQPEEVCDEAPVAGLLKACTLTASYGRYSKRTAQIDRSRVGRLNNLGEGTDFRVQNPMLAEDPFTPSMVQGGTGGWINREITARIFEAATGFQRMMIPQVYTGNPTNNSAGGGRRQFIGFDLQYNTGKVDVLTQTRCQGMDSVVADWGNVNVNEANANGIYFYQELESIMRYLRTTADKMGLSPVEWVISMTEDLFFTLSDTIPVQRYLQVIATLNNINGSDNGAHLNFDGAAIDAMRKEMRDGKFLPVDGIPVRVITDNGIAETAGSPATEYVSDVYIHAVSVLGGIPVLYWQFFNHDNAQGRELDAMIGSFSWTTDSGRFLWSSQFLNGCFQMQWMTEPRVMQHTPFLCARIENVAYQPLIHQRGWEPSDSNFYDGGRINGTVLSGYPQWSAATRVNLGVLG